MKALCAAGLRCAGMCAHVRALLSNQQRQQQRHESLSRLHLRAAAPQAGSGPEGGQLQVFRQQGAWGGGRHGLRRAEGGRQRWRARQHGCSSSGGACTRCCRAQHQLARGVRAACNARPTSQRGMPWPATRAHPPRLHCLPPAVLQPGHNFMLQQFEQQVNAATAIQVRPSPFCMISVVPIQTIILG